MHAALEGIPPPIAPLPWQCRGTLETLETGLYSDVDMKRPAIVTESPRHSFGAARGAE